LAAALLFCPNAPIDDLIKAMSDFGEILEFEHFAVAGDEDFASRP